MSWTEVVVLGGDGSLTCWCRAGQRELDDRDLDSGDDEGRMDRVGGGEGEEEAQPEMEELEKTVMDVEIPRQAGPEPSDGEVQPITPNLRLFQC